MQDYATNTIKELVKTVEDVHGMLKNLIKDRMPLISEWQSRPLDRVYPFF